MKHNTGHNLKLRRKGSRLKLKISASLLNFLFVKSLGNVICFLSEQATHSPYACLRQTNKFHHQASF